MARRPKGMGSVTFHKASGKWMARYKKRTEYYETEPEANAAVHRMIVEEGESRQFERFLIEHPTGESKRIDEAIEEYIDYKAFSLKDTSLDRIEQITKCHIIPKIGFYHCSELTDSMYYNKLIVPAVQEGLSFSSIKKIQDFMFPFCKWCTASSRRYMSRDPLDGVDKLTAVRIHGLKMRYGVLSPEDVEDESGDHSSVVVLSSEQREAFIEACRAKYSSGTPRFPHGEAFILIMYTGLRIGEMSALRWNDVNLEKKQLRIKSNLTQATCRDPNSPMFGKKMLRVNPYTKTNRPRNVPLGDMAYESIMKLYDEKLPGCQLVLHNRKGELVDPVVLQSSLRRIYNLAKISLPSGVNAHALRHTFASMCFENGMSVKQVSDLLGHKSTQLTIDTYIHLLGDVNLENMPELAEMR